MRSSSPTQRPRRRTVNEFLMIQRNWFRTRVKSLWVMFFILLLGFPLYIYSVQSNFLGLFGEMPSLKAIETFD
jgi:penicillin-binding protein 1A